jgi:thiol-disulfide isomerase/thioredoxin
VIAASFRHCLPAVALLVAVQLGASAAGAASGTATPTNLLAAADRSLAAGDLQGAVRQYREADRAAGGPCAACQLGLARAHNGLRAHAEALRSADAALRATTDRRVRAAAYHERGVALTAAAQGHPATLEQAVTAFREAIAIGDLPEPHFGLGRALLLLGRSADGTNALRKYLALAPSGPHARTARDLVADPRLAGRKLLPDLEMVTLGGERVTTRGLRGKVVLLDFWGTWCAPCRAAVPDLQRLNERMKGSPFVLVSISNDIDRTVLERFIAARGMDWVQVWDENHDVIGALDVRRYPTYVLVDHEGEVVFTASGWGPNVEREIETRVDRAVREATRSSAVGSP